MHVIGYILMATLILSSCTPRVALGPVYLYPKVEPIEIELRSFSFHPNHIAILKDSIPFTFRLKNTSEMKHNFTLMDAHKNNLISINVKPNESTAVTIESLDPGIYTFYCNRFLHRFVGMEGMLMVD